MAGLVAAVMSTDAPASFPGRDGLLVTFARDFDAGADILVTVDPKSGATEEIVRDTDDFLGDPHWSPDGELIAFTRISMSSGPSPSIVWTVNADGSGETMVGPGIALDFSPDGSKILIATDKGDLAIMNAGGGGRRTILKKSELLRRGAGFLTDAAWSPTGKLIAYNADKASGTSKRSLYVVRPNGTGKEPLPSLSGGLDPEWSPDGKTLFYERNTKVPVKVLSLKLGAKRPVKLTNGYAPASSPSGKALAFARVDDIFTTSLRGGGPKKLDLRPKVDIDPASGGLDWQPLRGGGSAATGCVVADRCP